MPKSICEIVREAEQNYLSGSTTLGKYVNFSMYETVERIYAYLNSKHISGEKDSLKRPKPFFNIVTAAVNVWYRATDIDRKDIRFIPQKSSSILLAFVANVLLQRWMDRTRFGTFLNRWGRTLAEYGGAVRKFVERDNDLYAVVIPWQRIVPDPVDFGAIPHIEKFYKTPAQLQNMATPGHPEYAFYDKAVVNALCHSHTTRKTASGQQKDNLDDFIEIFEVHGLLDERLLTGAKDEVENVRYVQQMHVVSYTAGDKEGEYQDFTLYKGREAKDMYGRDALIDEEGRSLPIGAVEYLFDSQWMHNHAIKAWKDNIDIASKQIFQTADKNFVGRNVLTAVEQGQILIHGENAPLTKVPNDEYDLGNVANFINQWKMLGNELVSTPDSIKGNTLPSGTPFSLGAYLGAQANNLFEVMTENKGLAIEQMMREYVIPHLRKQLKNKREIVALLDDAGIQEIDMLYVPIEAVRRFNERTLDQVESALQNEDAPMPQPFDMQAEQMSVKQGMTKMGNKRFFTPDDLGQKQWDEVFADFEWDSLRVEVTNENVDKQAVLQTLASLYTATLQTDPVAANVILAKLMSETGVMSPLQVASLSSRPTATPNATAAAGNALKDVAQVT